MKALLVANTDWYLYNFRLALARRLRERGTEVVLVSPPGPYAELLVAEGFRWLPLRMARRSLNPFRELRALAGLFALFRRERPELVHAYTIKCVVYGSLAARLAGVEARVGTVAGLGFVFASDALLARALRPLVSLLLKLALGGRGARLILQNPDDVAEFAARRLVAADKVRLVPGSGVDCTRFVPREGIAAQPVLRVAMASRLLWEKGVAEFVAAARRLRAEGRELRFLLAGAPDPGSPASVSEADVAGWTSEGVVELLGHVDDMPAFLAGADIMVLPSYREGLPKALIEAAACGLPLIASDAPGCRAVVDDGVEGLLVPVRDTAALATAIRRLDDDRELARRLGRAARQRALREFDERLVIDATLAVYDELLPGGAAHAR